MIFGGGNLKVYGAEKESVRGKVISSYCCKCIQGVKLRLIQAPMRLNFSLWRPNP